MRGLVVGLLLLELAAHAQTIPITGQAVAGLVAYDQAMLQLMAKYQIPGAALAVVREGRLVMAHGYGFADREARIPVQPNSLFRIFSISKPITATAIYKLVEQGKLRLDAKAFQILSRLKPPPGQTQDPRLQLITIQHLLDHKGGWDINALGFDPVGQNTRAAQVVGVTPPASAEVVIRYMLGIPLNFDPGSKSVYSNFGYSVLGRVIEEVSGMSYESFVKTSMFDPLGITRTAVGHTLRAFRFADEVIYYDYPGAPLARSVFPGTTDPVPWPYGGFYLESWDSFGGWVSSTLDLLRFLTSSNGSRPPQLLVSPPSGFPGHIPPFGPGWGWGFNGASAGARAGLRLDNRTAYAFLTNTWPAPASPDTFFQDFDTALVGTGRGVAAWPTTDLFPQLYFNPPALALSSTRLNFATTADGAAPAEQTVTLTNRGDGNLSISMLSDQPWLVVNPVRGTLGATPLRLTVSARIAGLSAGEYLGQITVHAPGAANTPQRMLVTLTVRPAAAPPPLFAAAGVVHAASFASGSIAPGEIVSIFGSNLGPAQGVGLLVDPTTKRLATSRAGVTVLFNEVPGPLFFVRQDQINVQVPYELAGASARIVVRNVNAAGAPVTVDLAPASPGIFTVSQARGQAALLNQDFSVNSTDNPAPRGSVVQIFLTGQGATTPPAVTGQLPQAPFAAPLLPVAVTIEGRVSRIQFVGLAPGLVGLLQVNAVVPDEVVPGAAVALQVTVGSAQSQAGVTLAVN